MAGENVSLNVSAPTEAPSSKNAATAGNIAQSNSAEGYTSSTKIDNMADLRKKAPKVWRAMLMGIAQNICAEMREHADRLKKMIRDGYQR